MDATSALTVDVPQLRATLEGLLKQIESEYGEQVYIDYDHYWLVELGAAFGDDFHEPGTKESDLGVGQISDDVESVAESFGQLRSDGRVYALWHDLEHAVGLLRALAHLDLPK